MIKIEKPPNWDQIVAAFPHAATLPTIFAYGEDIYNPLNLRVPQPLLAHEYRHCARQFATSADGWWTKYIADDEFRYTEELLGHVEEYRTQAQLTNDRNERAKIATRTAYRLIAPLYNYQPPRSFKQAMRDLESLL
ncbi:MAG TPA: hypothetical protein VGU20_31240 [Stellaceae bacterium]|nr:hypothetical protein [Terriglobia bacterium]HEV2551827.1 hypothetical protein [Stellaceae bacterium]